VARVKKEVRRRSFIYGKSVLGVTDQGHSD